MEFGGTPSARRFPAAFSVAAKCNVVRREHPIHLLGKRLAQIVGAQACLHVSHGNLGIKGRKRAAQSCGCVALHDNHGWLLCAKNRLQARENARCGLEQRLARQHQVQIVIRLYMEGLQNLIQHLPMLRGDADLHVEPAGVFAQAANHRAELNRLRPGAEDQQNFVHPDLKPRKSLPGRE